MSIFSVNHNITKVVCCRGSRKCLNVGKGLHLGDLIKQHHKAFTHKQTPLKTFVGQKFRTVLKHCGVID